MWMFLFFFHILNELLDVKQHDKVSRTEADTIRCTQVCVCVCVSPTKNNEDKLEILHSCN